MAFPQTPIFSQRIWGAFSPTSGQILGVNTSGEGVYQTIPNAAIATTYAAVRTATSQATQTVFAMGKNSVSDGLGGTYVFNPSDTTSGCVCIGSSAGTVLTVTSVTSGSVVVGQTLCSSVTGLPLATIVSNGTGSGGAGTYNLSGTVNQGGPFTFMIDNNGSPLVSADGSRWYGTQANFNALSATIGQMTVGPPPSGTALAVTGLTSIPALTVASSTGAAFPLSVGWNAGLVGTTWNIYTQSTDALAVGTAGATAFSLCSNGVIRTTINSLGGVTINAPTSGGALTVNGLAGAGVATLQQASGNDVSLGFNQVGVSQWFVTNKATSGSLALSVGGGDRLTVNTSGNFTISAPTSGTPLAINTAASANVISGSDGTGSNAWFMDASHQTWFGATTAHALILQTSGTNRITVAASGVVTVVGNLGVNNVSPPGRVTGWGAPTGGGIVANFPGATATLGQCSQAIAQLIIDLKNFGLYGA